MGYANVRLSRDHWYLRAAHALGLGCSRVAQERDAAACISEDFLSGLSIDAAISRYSYLTGYREGSVCSLLSGFSRNYDLHRSAGAEPLAFFDRRFLPARFDHDCFVRTLRDGARLSLDEAAEHLTKVYGMELYPEDIDRKPWLEPLLHHAVAAYNSASRDRIRSGARRMELLPGQYQELLRAHVSESLRRDPDRRGAQLGRFDRRLLPDYQAFCSEVRNLYAASDLTLSEIAEQQGRKYGMRLSAATVSRTARSAFAADGAPVSSRRARRRAGGARTTSKLYKGTVVLPAA